MKLKRKRFHVILPAVCLAILASQPVVARSPGNLADGPLPRASGTPQSQTPLAPQVQTSPDSQGQTLRFERISIAEGLSQSIVYSILQDQQGFMWFGTRGGLDKYDGYQFTVYKRDPDDPRTLSDNQVNAIYEDRHGELWIGTNRGLDRLDRTTETFAHYRNVPGDPQSLSVGAVLSIYEDRTGILWVGTGFGLNRFDRTTQTFTHYLQNNPVTVIYEDQRGELWIGTNNGLYRFDQTTETFTHYRHDPDDPASLSDNRVTAVLEDQQGALWIGTDGGGLDQLDRSTQAFVHYRHNPSESPEQAPDDAQGMQHSLSDDRVTAILEDSGGRLWVGTRSGLDQLDRSQNRFLHYRYDPSDPYSLSDDLVLSLYEDRSGVLWVGTLAGLSKHNRTANRFKLYQQGSNIPAGLSDNLVQAIYKDRNGTLWVGTFAGGLNKLDRNAERFTVYQHDPDDPTSLSSNDVRAVYEDHDGVLWVGTDLGLDQFDPQTETFIHYPSLGATRVTVITEDRSGYLWIGTSAGLYRPYATGVFRSFHPYGLSGNYVTAIYKDRTGALWVGTYGGGIRLGEDVNEQFTHYQHEPDDPKSLSSDIVSSFYENPAGMVWIGTEEGGLNRFDRASQTFTHYTEKDGLPGNTVRCILADSEGYLWLGTNKGLSRFDPQTEAFRNFGAQDGLQRGEFSLGACFQSDRGEIFFGGFEGLNAFYPEQIEPNPHIPAIIVTAFDKFNQTVRTDLPANEHIILSHQDNFISFEFAALDYTAPEKNQYTYMMEGLDQDWVYAGTRRHADYPNLPPGDYVLRVKGSNNDGIWNEDGVAIRITVTPPLWETWWFRGVALLALVGAVIGGYRLRVRSIEARSHELERQVEERTHEIEQRRQVAEGLRDILAVLNSNRPLDEILDYIVAQAGRLLGSEASVLHHIEQDQQFVAIEASFGLPDELMTIEGFPLYASGADEAILRRQSFIRRDIQEMMFAGTDDAEGDPQSRRWLAITGQHYRSLLAVPLIVEDEVYGCITFYYTEPQAFSDEEIGLAVALADQASLAIENARLRNRAEQAAVTAERNRLARDMHDSVTQDLFSLTLLTEAGQRMIKAQDLGQIEDNQALLSEIARRALQEMRLMVYELRPLALESEGLIGTLEQRLEAVERRAGVNARLVVEGACALSQSVEEELYRIAQEALNNALKHAGASTVTVTIWAEDDKVALEVIDNGRGFDPEEVRDKGGLGLVSMQERAEELGGTLTILSTGEGTRVRVVVSGY